LFQASTILSAKQHLVLFCFDCSHGLREYIKTFKAKTKAQAKATK